MNRQSFERWIYQGEAPPEGEAELLAPASGFSQRWMQRWEAEQVRQQESKAFWLALLSAAGFLVIAILLVKQSLPLFEEPSSLHTGLVNGVVDFVSFLVVLFRVSGSLLRVTPSSVWLVLASTISMAALLSVLALNRFVTQKGALR